MVWTRPEPRQLIEQAPTVDKFERGDIRIWSSRGVQVGDSNVQVNSFEFKVRPKVDWQAAFDRLDYQKLSELARNPSDDGLRASIVRDLRGTDILGEFTGDVFVSALTLQNTRIQDDSSPIESLLIFWCQGVQVGDHQTQRNNFSYIVTGRVEASALLKANPKLAQAIVDAAVPRDQPSYGIKPSYEREPDQDAMLRNVDWSFDKQLGERFDPPGPGSLLIIRDSDGISVGRWNSQRNSFDFDVSL